MATDSFFGEGSRLLTPNAFASVLDGELKRAVRSQNFLTLVVLETRRDADGVEVTADDGIVEEVAQLVGSEVRDTDRLGRADQGSLSLLLLDADADNSARVIDRLVSRIDSYDFPAPLRISVGAACYPTHAVDADSLKRQAVSRPVIDWRGGPAAKSSPGNN
jgi:GGDEF domain-containing protein